MSERERELRRLYIITELSGASASDPPWVWGLGFLPNERDDATSEREMMHFDGGLHRGKENLLTEGGRGSSRDRAGFAEAQEVVEAQELERSHKLICCLHVDSY